MYGVSYWAGSVVGLSSGDSELLDSTLVLAAMPDEPVLEEAIRAIRMDFMPKAVVFAVLVIWLTVMKVLPCPTVLTVCWTG